MTDDGDTTWPLLDEFFAAELWGRTSATIARYQQVEARLATMLSEDDLGRWLGPDGERLLRYLRRGRHVDMRRRACAFWDAESALLRARRRLRVAAGSGPRDTPGPGWP